MRIMGSKGIQTKNMATSSRTTPVKWRRAKVKVVEVATTATPATTVETITNNATKAASQATTKITR